MSEITTRGSLIDFLADTLEAYKLGHPLRVGIDGIDAAGKTSLANELVAPLEARGRVVIRASIDGFHNPRKQRYRFGPDSPEGYYRDSFNTKALVSQLLNPLGPGGSLHYRPRVFDYREDQPVQSPFMTADPNSILLCDGVFLQQPNLEGSWDFSIFLAVGFETALSRAVTRDIPEGASPYDVRDLQRKYHSRYFPGQRIYLQECNPLTMADVVIDNNDVQRPRLVKFRPCISF